MNDIVNQFDSNIDGLFTVNDLKLFLLMFADDAVLFAHTPMALQSLLNHLNMYCNTLGLKVNTSKTKIRIFENGRHTQHIFYLNDAILYIVTFFKYLGIHLLKNGHMHRNKKNRKSIKLCAQLFIRRI